MPALSGPLVVGRGAFSGPLVGGPLIYPFGPFQVAISQTDLIGAACQAPCDMRLERITWSTRSASGAAADLIKFMSHPTAVQVAGATSLISAASVDLDANLTSFAAPSGEVVGSAGVTLSTALGIRDIVKNSFFFVAVTTDATAGGVIDLNVIFTFFATGFSNVNSVND